MRKLILFSMLLFLIGLLISSCGVFRPKWKSVQLTKEETETADLLNFEYDYLKKLKVKPLYQFNPQDLNTYLGYLQSVEPNLRNRVQHLARKAVGQPYRIFLLGEFPYEIYDADPLFSLNESDCVVFSEHIYAMALSYDWKSFFAILQRIRYKNGEIGFATRNHYTEFDWDVNNDWLVEDITEELGGENTAYATTVVDRAAFMAKYGIGQMMPVDTVTWSYLPYQLLPEVVDKLQPGDFVNIVRGFEDNKWVGHVGLITVDEEGTRYFLHSTSPEVKEQPILELYETAEQHNAERKAYNEKVFEENLKIRERNLKVRAETEDGQSSKLKKLKRPRAYFYGFKFLRLREDPIWELMKIEGPNVPKVQTAPVFD